MVLQKRVEQRCFHRKTLVKKLFFFLLILLILIGGTLLLWANQPLLDKGSEPIGFGIKPGSGVRASGQQVADAGVPLQPLAFEVLARVTGNSTRLKAGSYALEAGTTPLGLVQQIAKGQFAHESLAIIEGWNFRQMRAAIAANTALKHDTLDLSDAELLAKVAPNSEYSHPEGLFFPDTYLFAKGASELQVYRQAHASLMKRLQVEWEKRDPDLPYKTPYDALIMASIIEKETGREAERATVAAVFINRLRLGMLLQTDPTVIYGMGERYEGRIRKRDLLTDTIYNTYTRAGLPPTPIALPGARSLRAAFRPAQTKALYFVARGDGTSHFSNSLDEHNRAVDKFQRGRSVTISPSVMQDDAKRDMPVGPALEATINEPNVAAPEDSAAPSQAIGKEASTPAS